MLDLPIKDVKLVRRILDLHVPTAKVLAYGSRVRGFARKFSDLDLALDTGGPIAWSVLGDLREALSESDLPIKVDLIDLNGIPERIRESVLRHAIPFPAVEGRC